MLNMLYKSKNGYMGVIYGNGRHLHIYAKDEDRPVFSISSAVPTEKISVEALHALVDNYPEHAGKIFKLLEDLNIGEGN